MTVHCFTMLDLMRWAWVPILFKNHLEIGELTGQYDPWQTDRLQKQQIRPQYGTGRMSLKL